jgi:hypothetical protein
MHKWFFGLAAVAFAVVAAPAQDDVVAVVKKAIDAHGGAKALDQYPAGYYKMKGRLVQDKDEREFTGETTYQRPDKLRVTLELDSGGGKTTVLQVVNGKQAKQLVNDKPAPLTDAQKAELLLTLKLQEVTQFTPLLDPTRYVITAEKPAKVGTEEAAVVLVTGKDFKDTRLFFSKATGLLVKTERKGLAPGGADGKEVTEETLLSDYKKVDGVMSPMKMTVNHDGKKFMEMTVVEAKLTDKADPKLFAVD